MYQLVHVLSELQLLFWIPSSILNGITEKNRKNVVLTVVQGLRLYILSVTNLCFNNLQFLLEGMVMSGVFDFTFTLCVLLL